MRRFCCLLALSLPFLIALPAFAGGPTPWPAISSEDLAMKDYAPYPGAHAVILTRKLEGNDKLGWERNYYRIKILDEEGKQYANVEIGTYPKQYKVVNIEARTIRPDGTIVPFTGQIFEKSVAKYKSLGWYAKAFTLPDVQVGSIIEYRYTVEWSYDSGGYPPDVWMVQSTLPIRDAEFSRIMFGQGYSLKWLICYIEQQPKIERDTVRLFLKNVAPFEKETLQPPEDELRARVEFTYHYGKVSLDSDEYWKDAAVAWSKATEEYMDRRKAAEREVATLISPGDTPEAKLHKLYNRIQKMRNLSYEREKTEQEAKREKLKDNRNVEDVLKNGYGYQNQLNCTFVALARASGFDATVLRVIERDQYFFHKEVEQIGRLVKELAVVNLDGKTIYLDPSLPFAPFGMLSWEDTGVKGLLLDRNNAVWSSTPQPEPQQTLTKRTADLTLDSDGTLKGQLVVDLRGQNAIYRRVNGRADDDAARKKNIEEMIKGWLPSSATVELGKIDDWSAPTDSFIVSAAITLPGFAAATGKRTMVPISIFPGSDKNLFQSAKRVHPVYLRNPYTDVDEIRIKLPEGMQVESLPQTREIPTGFSSMKVSVTKQGNELKIDRKVTIRGYYFQPEHYPDLRAFLDSVKAVGDEQAVLRANAK